MTKGKALTNLLAENRRICKLLHNMSGIDWEKPISVTEYTGKFTFNSISKEVNRITGDGIIGYNVYLLYRKTFGCFKDDLFLVEVGNTGFNVLKDEIRNGNKVSSYYYKVELEYRKGDFEESRKNETTHYWLVIQNNGLENHRKPIYDESARYVVKDFSTYRTQQGKGTDYIGRFEIKPIDRNYGTITVSPNGRSNFLCHHVPISERYNIVDKSGYRVSIQRDNYKRKVNEIKLEKSKAAAAVYDKAPKIAEIEARYEKIHALIIGNLTAKPNYRKIEKAVSRLDWIGDRFNNFKNHDFTTMSEVNRALSFIEDCLNEAEKALTSEV